MFVLGDVVLLKSEQKEMTVCGFSNDVNGYQMIYCEWFNKEYNLQGANFYPICLMKTIKTYN
ncbi:TPA: YodC family protein [Providencia alcalifaciens]